MSRNFVPAITSETSLAKYLQDIQQFPVLTEKEEQELVNKWHKYQDLKAAHALVTSHLRLVAKIALKYRGYGLPMTDIIAEGNIGLMHAVKKFAPEMGHRLSTYAMWWIKAYIQDYILKSWSLVKIGTSAVQKRLFFNLRRIKNKLLNIHGHTNIADSASIIAQQLQVTPQEVIDMDNRMSCNESILNDVNESGVEKLDLLMDTSESPESIALEHDEHLHKKALVNAAMSKLNEREHEIVKARILQEAPSTLEELSVRFGISRERVRQIESKAMEKLQRYCLEYSNI